VANVLPLDLCGDCVGLIDSGRAGSGRSASRSESIRARSPVASGLGSVGAGAAACRARRLRRPRGSVGRSGLGRSANPAAGGRPARGGAARVRPLAAAGYAREGRTRRLGGRGNRKPFDLFLPIPTKRSNASNPPPGAALAPSLTNRPAAAPGGHRPAPGPHPLASPKRPAQPTGRRQTPVRPRR
jgi:hypothetical protein